MTCDTYMRIWSVRSGHEQHRDKCHLFIPRCAYNAAGMTARTEFEGTKDAKGIEILREEDRVLSWLKGVDWAERAMGNISGFLRLRNRDIEKAVMDGGFKDSTPPVSKH